MKGEEKHPHLIFGGRAVVLGQTFNPKQTATGKKLERSRLKWLQFTSNLEKMFNIPYS